MPTFKCDQPNGWQRKKCHGRLIVHKPVFDQEDGGIPLGVCFRCGKARSLSEREFQVLLTTVLLGEANKS